MALEQTIQTKILKYLNKVSYVVKVIAASKSGVHDIIVCYHGLFISFEVKTPATRDDASPLQLYNRKRIIANGGISKVVCSLQEVIDTLKELQC